MMNHTGSIALGLGIFFAVPAITVGDGLPDSLETALDETLYALKVLGELDKRFESGESLSVQTMVDVTESGMENERASDERLTELRDEVAGLQAKFDIKKINGELASRDSESANHAREETAAPVIRKLGPTMGTAGVSQGLSSTFIKALGSGQIGPQSQASDGHGNDEGPASQPTSQPIEKHKETAGSHEDKPGEHSSDSPEGKGYSANPMRQAQACFKAGRYEQGLSLLEAAEPSPLVDYWMARMLERLGRIDEAVKLYTAIETNDEAAELHTAAKRDREFAEWRRDFLKKSGLNEKSEDA